MKLIRSTLYGFLTVYAVVVAGACSSPAQPSASVGAATPLLPAGDSQVFSQPITLVAQNATVSGGANPTYTFEVATDAAFTAKVQTKSVSQSASGQTSVILDTLTNGKDYFWHVRAEAGGTTGTFSGASKFSLLPFGPPGPVSPSNGASVGGWPTLTVTNAQRAAGAGSLQYRFELSTSSTFASILVSSVVAEMPSQTTFTPSLDLPSGGSTTVYWRVTAIDQTSGASGPTSNVQGFVLTVTQAARIAAQEGVVLWPGTQPPGTGGQVSLGSGWDVRLTTSIHGVVHTTPTLDELRNIDLLDRGFAPQDAIDWINSHGYSTEAAYYPAIQVIGFPFEYLAFVNGSWQVVFKLE